MSSVRPFPIQIFDRSFDDEATAILCSAFDNACAALFDKGQSQPIRETIAKRIIEIAGRGERDQENMCEAALISLGLKANRFAISPRNAAARTGKSRGRPRP